MALLQALRRLNSAGRTAAQHIHRRRVGHDRPHHQETGNPHQLAAREPQDEGTQRHDGHGHQERHQLDGERRANGQDRQDGPHDGITEKSAQAEAVCLQPFRPRRQRRRVDRAERDGNGREYQPTDSAVLAPVQSKAPTPEQQNSRNAPRPPAHDHEQWCCEGSTHATHPVLYGGIRADHPVWIVGRIAADHHAGHDAQRNQHEPEQFLAALLDRLGHVAIHQWVTPASLICHCSFPSYYAEYRQSRIASNPRVVSFFGATSATRIYVLPGLSPFTSCAR